MLPPVDLAKGLGIDPALVRRYLRKGMPGDSVEAARAWKVANVRPRMMSQTNGKGATSPPAASPQTSAYQDARTRWAIAEANERELAVLERKGQLVPRSLVRAEVSRQLVGLKQSLLQIPARLQSVLAAESDEAKVHDLLQDEITAALQQVSEGAA